MTTATPTSNPRYVVGLDMGSYSVGMAALEIDDDGVPIGLLAAVSHIHDGGVDPTGAQDKDTRRAVSGIARRTQRRRRSVRKVRARLDAFLTDNGYEIVDYVPGTDTDPWQARAILAQVPLDPETLRVALPIAARHMVRHRGHRNPFLPTSRLHSPGEPSSAYVAIKERIEELTGTTFDDSATIPQMVVELRSHDARARLRGNRTSGKGGDAVTEFEGVLSSQRIRQSDHARELLRIGQVQGLDSAFVNALIDRVFDQKSPKGSAGRRASVDALPGQTGQRAWRALPAFQRYRIAAQLGNARLARDGERVAKGRLSPEQMRSAFDLLTSWTDTEPPTWDDVAERIGLSPGQLRAPVSMLDDGENITTAPFTDTTHRSITRSKCKSLAQYWTAADEVSRRVAVLSLSNADILVPETTQEQVADAEITELNAAMTDEDIAALDSLRLDDGRAAYSEDSLVRLTERMLSDGCDLYTARRAEFGVPEDWSPPTAPITEPTGNSAVDRSIRQVNRMLIALERRYGPPERITIEHVRAGMSSAKVAADHERQTRFKNNGRNKLREAMGVQGRPSMAQMRRFEIVTRQNGQCLYCGTSITVDTCEIDHIVPRAGLGSTNTADNLVGSCHRCNASKGKLTYATWARTCGIEGTDRKSVYARMKQWNVTPGTTKKDLSALVKRMQQRLRRTSLDEPIDSRSIESVSWMATELRRRLRHHYTSRGMDTSINVYRGSITYEARSTWVAGTTPEDAVSVNTSVPMHGGTGKQRLDRRHHALDAAVISVVTPYAAQVLAERQTLRLDARLGISQSDSGDASLPGGDVAAPWKEHTGTTTAHKSQFALWQRRTDAVITLMSAALSAGEVPVVRSLRLGLSQGRVHEDKVHALLPHLLGSEWSPEQIAAVVDRRVWTALTRLADFSWRTGLPTDPERTVTIQGSVLDAGSNIGLAGKPRKDGGIGYADSVLPVRGGWAYLGEHWHHMRLYRTTGPGKTMILRERVYVCDLAKYVRPEDSLFDSELPRHTISRRSGLGTGHHSKTYAEHMEGQTEYLGWITSGDEIHIPADFMLREKMNSHVKALQDVLGGPITRWVVSGTSEHRVMLKPAELAYEGIATKEWTGEQVAAASKVLSTEGWRVSLSSLFTAEGVAIVRRTVLGEIRRDGSSGLPTSWTVEMKAAG